MAWNKPTNLREWLDIFLRHRKKFLFVSIPVAMVVIIGSHYVERKYTASAIMEVRNHLAIQQIGDQVTARATKPMRRLLHHDIVSRKAIEQVIDDLELLRDMPIYHADGELTAKGQMIKSDMVDKMRKGIAVSYIARTSELDRARISYTDLDRELAPRIVNKLVDNYIQDANALFDKKLISTKSFFEAQVARHRQNLQTEEAKLMRFRAANPGLEPDDPLSVDAKLVTLQAKLDRLNSDINVLTEERRALQGWLKSAPEMIISKEERTNPEWEATRQRLNALEIEYYNFRNRPGGPTEAHPESQKYIKMIRDLKVKVKELPQRIVADGEAIVNEARIVAAKELETMSGRLAGHESQRAEVKRQYSVYEVRKSNFVELRNKYLNMKRTISEHESQHEFYANKLRATQIALSAAVGNRSVTLTVIDRPREHIKPSHPTLSKILIMSLVLGIGFGGGAIVLSEMLDRSFHNVQHAVDDLKLPVLGAVNEIITQPMIFRRKLFAWGVYPTIGAMLVMVLVVSIILAHLSLVDPSMYEEIMRQPGRMLSSFILG
ncbi:MAG: hypothetical protein CMJ18_10475 [Phycisphaeraceae bacterium]|nr:hypothetical protein [Phycisphaeraceae bacterium]